jgi:ferredoxin
MGRGRRAERSPGSSERRSACGATSRGPKAARRRRSSLARPAYGTHDAALRARAAVTDPAIAKVWIETGCISCKLCQDIAPDVFLVEDDRDCVIRPEAAQCFARLREEIEQAARDCPVEVIKIGHRG